MGRRDLQRPGVWGGGGLGRYFGQLKQDPILVTAVTVQRFDTVGLFITVLKVTQYMDRYCWVFITVTVSHITMKTGID